MTTIDKLTIEESYGFEVKTGLEANAAGWTRSSSEFKDPNHGTWMPTNGHSIADESWFSAREIYRRRISPGPDWEIVPIDAELKAGDEALSRIGEWIAIEEGSFILDHEKTPRGAVQGSNGYWLVVRRRKHPEAKSEVRCHGCGLTHKKEPSVKSRGGRRVLCNDCHRDLTNQIIEENKAIQPEAKAGWIRCSDRTPINSRDVWAYAGRIPIKAHYASGWYNSIGFAVSTKLEGVTHWHEIEAPGPPVPEINPDEEAFNDALHIVYGQESKNVTRADKQQLWGIAIAYARKGAK